MRKLIYIILAIGCGIYSCSPALYKPSSPDATQQKQLVEGRNLYINHCGNCHNLHLPRDYTAATWRKNLDEMQARAKMNNSEKESIYQYLTYKPGK